MCAGADGAGAADACGGGDGAGEAWPASWAIVAIVEDTCRLRWWLPWAIVVPPPASPEIAAEQRRDGGDGSAEGGRDARLRYGFVTTMEVRHDHGGDEGIIAILQLQYCIWSLASSFILL